MNELKVFESEQFGKVRVIEHNDQVWFVAKDVCDVLEIQNPTMSLKNMEEDEVTKYNLGGQHGETSIINESGLYNLIFKSRKDNAKKFKKWVTSVVLPSIRNSGGYIANQENSTPEQIVANALVVAQNIIDTKNKQIETMKPKVDFYDTVAGSKDAIEIGTVAKLINVRGLGRNNLFELLRDKNILMDNNQPYQKYIDCGYFRTIEQKWSKDGEIKINIKTLVYQKGIDYIRKIVI